MDPTISQLLGSIDGKLTSLEGKVDKLTDGVAGLSKDIAVERQRVGELERRIVVAEAGAADLRTRVEAAQRRLDEAEGARRGATAAGVAGVVSGLSGLGGAAWLWLQTWLVGGAP